jgi:hypothetical protein
LHWSKSCLEACFLAFPHSTSTSGEKYGRDNTRAGSRAPPVYDVGAPGLISTVLLDTPFS